MIRPRSIRTKLTLWYTGILAVSLLGFGALFYLSVAFNLRQETDRSLGLQAEAIVSEIKAFREAEQASDAGGPGNWHMSPLNSAAGMVDRGLFSNFVTRWAEKTGSIDRGRPIRLLSSSGSPLLSSSKFDTLWARMPKFDSKKRFQTLELPEEPFRLTTHPMIEDGRVIGYVQTATSLKAQRASLRLLALWLGSLLPFILLVATIAGWFLAGRALNPVDRIITQVEEISADALEKRVDIPHTGDELERLARTFDHMLERIERAFRRLRQFSAAASHELRTPLTVMKGELEVALRRPRTSQEYETILRIHLDALNDLVHIVEELLTLARSEASKGAVEWKSLDLSELGQQVGELWHKVADGKGVKLEILQGKPVWVTGEKRLLERLVSNLIDNALRVTSAEGKVTVRVDRWKDKAQLMVQDTGSGIAAQDLPHIFDRFFQPRSAEDKPGSTGLGLGLCRWIAEAHHGRIEVSSVVGRGTLFTVWLPAGAGEPKPLSA